LVKRENAQHTTGSLAQAGVLSRVTPRRILEVRLPSEPYRYPRLPQAAKTIGGNFAYQPLDTIAGVGGFTPPQLRQAGEPLEARRTQRSTEKLFPEKNVN